MLTRRFSYLAIPILCSQTRMQASCPDADPDLEPKPHAGVPESDCEPGSEEEEEEADEEEMCAGSQ